MLGHGAMDFYSRYRSKEPICVESCPPGSEEVEHMCVAPKLGGWGESAREILITLHVPCEDCVDAQAALAGWLWLGIVRLLHVPLHETVASVFFVASDVRPEHRLEHFTWRAMREVPLIAEEGLPRSGPVAGSWDFYLAIRIHTLRILEGNEEFEALMNRDARPLVQSLGATGSVYVFEAVSRKSYWVWDIEDLVPTFKARRHDWDKAPSRPPTGAENGTAAANDSDVVAMAYPNTTIGPVPLLGADAAAPTALEAVEAAQTAEDIGSVVLWGAEGAEPTSTTQASTSAAPLPVAAVAATAAPAPEAPGMLSADAMVGIGTSSAIVLILAAVAFYIRYKDTRDDDDEVPTKVGVPAEMGDVEQPFKVNLGRAQEQPLDSPHETLRSVSSSDTVTPPEQPSVPAPSRGRSRREPKVWPAPEEAARPPLRRATFGPEASTRREGMGPRASEPPNMPSATFDGEGRRGAGRRHSMDPSRREPPSPTSAAAARGAAAPPADASPHGKAGGAREGAGGAAGAGAGGAAAGGPAGRGAAAPPPGAAAKGAAGGAREGAAGGGGAAAGGAAAGGAGPQGGAQPRDSVGSRSPVAEMAAALIADTMAELDRNRGKPLEVRKRVFKELQRQLHPDKNIDNAEAANMAFVRLMESRPAFLAP